MKVTVSFLGKKNNVLNWIYSKYKKIVTNLSVLMYCLFISFCFFFFAKYILLSSNILYFGTNIRQASEDKIEVCDVVNMFEIYNNSNYILKKENINQDVKILTEEEKNQNENKEKFEIIDAMANKVIDKTVFFNSGSSVNITENSDNLQRINIDTTKILNYSSKRDIDFKSLADGNVTFTKKSDKILLYNTHTSESYSNSDKYKFNYTGTKRTTDSNFNMLFITKNFDINLKAKGFEVVQDTTPHDYGTYTSAYAKSRITVKQALTNMNGAGISIDVHRDAAADLEYRPVVNINGVQVAQCMFVIGVGTDSNKNEYAQDNLKLAIKLQKIADNIYPGLFKSMIVRNSIYNQDLNKYSILIEVGATGNTIDEAILSTRCLTNLLNILYKD